MNLTSVVVVVLQIRKFGFFFIKTGEHIVCYRRSTESDEKFV